MKEPPFTFISEAKTLYPDALVGRVPSSVSSKGELLSVLAQELQFPDYFGHNWDALSDCLRDFHWVTARRVVIVHDGLPMALGERDLRTYLEILDRCVRDWKPGEDHELVVVFPSESYETIENLLHK